MGQCYRCAFHSLPLFLPKSPLPHSFSIISKHATALSQSAIYPLFIPNYIFSIHSASFHIFSPHLHRGMAIEVFPQFGCGHHFDPILPIERAVNQKGGEQCDTGSRRPPNHRSPPSPRVHLPNHPAPDAGIRSIFEVLEQYAQARFRCLRTGPAFDPVPDLVARTVFEILEFSAQTSFISRLLFHLLFYFLFQSCPAANHGHGCIGILRCLPISPNALRSPGG